MWGQSVYFSLQFMGHLEGKSGHQPNAGTWEFVDCFLACSPWVAQFAFLYPPASHQLKPRTYSKVLLIGSLIEAFFLLKFPLLKKTLACVKYTKNKHCRQGFCHTSCNNNKCIKCIFIEPSSSRDLVSCPVGAWKGILRAMQTMEAWLVGFQRDIWESLEDSIRAVCMVYLTYESVGLVNWSWKMWCD